MTTEEAVREQLKQARQESDRLYGQFMQFLGNPQMSKHEVLHALELFRTAEQNVVEFRNMLHYVLKAEVIRQDMSNK